MEGYQDPSLLGVCRNGKDLWISLVEELGSVEFRENSLLQAYHMGLG